MKTLRIILVGIAAGEPSSYSLIEDLVRTLVRKNVNIMLALENRDQEYLKKYKDYAKRINDHIEGLIHKNKLDGYFKEYSSGLKVWDEKNGTIQNVLIKKLNINSDLKSKNLEEILRIFNYQIRAIRERSAFSQAINLADTCNSMRIKFLDSTIDEKQSFDNNDKKIYKEKIFKVRKVLNQAILNCDETSNVLIFFVGAGELKCTAALMQWVLKLQNYSSKLSIDIIPVVIYSQYTLKEVKAEIYLKEKELLCHLPENIKEEYNQLTLQQIEATEIVKTQKFSSEKFEKLIEELSLQRFVIFGYNKVKGEVVSSLGGIVKAIYKNGSALVEVDHSKLNKVNREKLGLSSKYLKFEGESSQEQMQYIKNIPGVTSHKTRKENSLWITFPKRISEIVREAYQDWPSVQARYKKFQTKVDESEMIMSQLVQIQKAARIKTREKIIN